MFIICKRFSLRKNGYITLFFKDKKYRTDDSSSWWTIDLNKAFLFKYENSTYKYLYKFRVNRYSKKNNKFLLDEETVKFKNQENQENLEKIKGSKFYNKILTIYS